MLCFGCRLFEVSASARHFSDTHFLNVRQDTEIFFGDFSLSLFKAVDIEMFDIYLILLTDIVKHHFLSQMSENAVKI